MSPVTRSTPEGEDPRPSIRDLIQALVDSSDRLGSEARNIYNAGAISKGIRSFFIFAVGAILALGVVNGWQIFELRNTNSSNKAISEAIRDCIQPTGRCYQDARNNRSSNTNYNKEVVIGAVQCATDGLKEQALRNCIENSLKKAGVKP